MDTEDRWWLGYRKPGVLPVARYWEDGGMRLAWNEFGDPGGSPVVFHHGWPSSRWQAHVVDALARDRGLRILAMDRPGLGGSPWAPGFRIDDWPTWVARFLDARGIGRFSQIAVSGGGLYAVACASALADRVLATSVLCGAVPLTAETMSRLPLAYRMLEKVRHLPDWTVQCGLDLACAAMRGDPRRAPLRWLPGLLPEPDRHLLLECPELTSTLVAALCEGLGQGARSLMNSGRLYLDDWKPGPKTICGPIRFWHGGLDRTIPVELARSFIQGIPGAKRVEIAGDAHFSLAIHQAATALDALTRDSPASLPGA